MVRRTSGQTKKTQRHWGRLSAITAVFALKLAVVLQLKDHPLLQADAGLDTSVYMDLARRVVAGDLTLGPGLYFVSPLYIYFIAAVMAVTDSLTLVRVVQAALGTAAVVCIFIAGREWRGDLAGWIAAALSSLTGLFTFYETLVLQAALDPFLTAASLCALTLALRRGSPRWATVAGVVFGLQILNRPNVLIAAAGIALLMFLTHRWRRTAALLVAGAVLALAPVTIRNVVVAGAWAPMSSHGGLNFYIGNNPGADGTYRGVPGITPNIVGQQQDATRVAEQAVGHPLDDAGVSTHFYGRGLSWIAAEPMAAASLSLRKLRYTFSASHLPLNYSFPFFVHDTRSLLAVLVVGPWLLVPLGLVGLAAPLPRERRSDYLIWVSFVPLYALSVALFFASERYRLPLLVPLCIGGGAAVAWIAAIVRRSEWRRAAVWLGACAVLAIIVNWPLRLDDGRAEARVRMAERLVQRDRFAEAEEWTTRALERHPTPGLVHFRVGRALHTRGHAAAAVPHLEQAARLDPERAETSYALGQALVDAGRPSQAIPHLHRAVTAGIRADLAGFDLARALAATGDRDGALQVLKDVTPARTDDAASWYGLGKLAQQLGDARLAAQYYGESARAAPHAPEPRKGHGLMLALQGEFEAAVREFEIAVTLNPSDATARLNLAAALAELGRVPEAGIQAQEALRLDPGYAKARELLMVLKK